MKRRPAPRGERPRQYYALTHHAGYDCGCGLARLGNLAGLHGHAVDARRHGAGLCRDHGARGWPDGSSRCRLRTISLCARATRCLKSIRPTIVSHSSKPRPRCSAMAPCSTMPARTRTEKPVSRKKAGPRQTFTSKRRARRINPRGSSLWTRPPTPRRSSISAGP